VADKGARPFYVVAHNPNRISDVRKALERGANAIEPDVQWNPHRNELCINHDVPLPTSDPPSVDSYLNQIAGIALEDPRLALIIFDSKLARAEFGSELLSSIHTHLADVRLNVIISIADLSMTGFFSAIGNLLGPREGLMIDQEKSVEKVVRAILTVGASQIGYGDGILAAIPAPGVRKAIDHALFYRAAHGRPQFIYTWVIAAQRSMRDYIRAGVDGMIVEMDDIRELVQILREPTIAPLVRLATRADDPFAPQGASYAIRIRTLDRTNAGTDAKVTFRIEGTQPGHIETTIDGQPVGRFESGSVNDLAVTGLDVGIPQRLTLQHDGTGNAPDWLPDEASVWLTDDPTERRADFGAWLSGGVRSSQLLGTSHYRLTVKTSDKAGAGTDADVAFVVTGSDGSVRRRFNGHQSQMFERNHLDVVELHGIAVGTLASVTVANDGGGLAPDWHLHTIRVETDDGQDRTFTFDQWVSAGSSATRP
jgi:glycerophosphoryl diester phosphodiesterase